MTLVVPIGTGWRRALHDLRRIMAVGALLCLGGQAAPEAPALVLTMINARTLPDLAHSPPGKGFTVTGLADVPDGTVWAANDGRLREDDGTPYRPSLVHLSHQLRSVLGEVQLPFASSVQGLAVVGKRLWFALPSEQAIASVTLPHGGNLRVERRLSYRPNGLGYNSRSHELLVGSEVARTIVAYPIGGGSATRTLMMPADAPDQLLVTRRGLLVSSGANRQPGKLILLRDDGIVLRRWTLPQSQAIEGMLLRGDWLIVANDAWFHRAGAELNQIVRYRSPAEVR